MSDHCTVLLQRHCYQEIAEYLKANTERFIRIDGEPGKWSRIEVESAETKVLFNALIWEAPMDQFSKTILGMGTWARGAQDGSMSARDVADRVSRVEMLIGVVAPDGFRPEAEGLVFGLCEALDGLVFTGSEILDASAAILVSEK